MAAYCILYQMSALSIILEERFYVGKVNTKGMEKLFQYRPPNSEMSAEDVIEYGRLEDTSAIRY